MCILYLQMVRGDLRLLVIGGEASYSRMGLKMIISDVELLDPFDKDSNCISPPKLPFPRKCFVSESLDERPFIAGGGNTGVMYDTSLVLINNTWIDTPIRLNHSRYCAISSQPKPKTMLVLGGDYRGVHTGMTSEILQDFVIETTKSTNTSRTAFRDIANAPMDIKYSRTSRKCTAKINDTHLFITGYQNNLTYIVDISVQPYTFTKLPKMKFGSHNGGACATITDSLGDTRLFVAGGGNAQIHNLNLSLMVKTEFFDIFTNNWIEGPDLPRMFYMGGYVEYPDERGFVLIGGEDLTNFGRKSKYFSDLMQYNQTTNHFDYLPKRLNIARSRFGALLVNTSSENCTIVSKITTTSHANLNVLPDFVNMTMLSWFIVFLTMPINIRSM